MRAVKLVAATALAMAGCSAGPVTAGDASTNGVGIDGAVRTYSPTFDAVWSEVLLPNCTICHGGSADYLELSSEAAGYSSLVNAMAQGPDCAKTNLLRVAPYRPATSLLYLKVTSPPCGHKMPDLPGNLTLDPRDVAQIRRWIECGAHDGDAGCSGDAGAGAANVDSSDAATD